MAENIPIVCFTHVPIRNSYYQWFLYGFLELERQGKIRIKYRLGLFERASFIWSLRYLFLFARGLKSFIADKFNIGGEIEEDSIFRGYVVIDGTKKSFCIDSADGPFMFSSRQLKKQHLYFKMQCPREIDEKGFLIGNIWVPYCDRKFKYRIVRWLYPDRARGWAQRHSQRLDCTRDVLTYKNKIRPLMVGVRKLALTNSYADLKSSYENLKSSRSVDKTQKAMCYFGNSMGPVPVRGLKEINYHSEEQFVGKFEDRINHPNEKRSKVADILNSLGDGYDGRVIIQGASDEQRMERRDDLVVPLKDFSSFVAQFAYNINISGYRMSIPNRFIDSFVSGTAIATDNLHVKWYHPFGKEVVEIGEMGYLPNEEVDYDAVREKLKNLPSVSKEEVIDNYEKYWTPTKVCEYIISELKKVS